MKKLVFIMPLMAVSLLASCGNKSTTYTITFNCTDCKVFDENKKEITSAKISASGSCAIYSKFYLYGKSLYKPLESSIKVEKTNKNEAVDFDYNPLTGEMFIPVIDNLTVTASGVKKTLEDCTWLEIKEISTIGRADEFFDIGDTKKIQLKHQDLDNDGEIDDNEVYQTVRIIGFNEDYTELPEPGEDPDPNKAIDITFEFVDLISDANGYSLATFWKNTSSTNIANYDYKNSSVRKALTKEGGGDLHWFEKEGTEFSTNTNYANKSVLEMLPDELSNVLATTSKYVNINDGSWGEQTVEDKLFLLSPKEMGNTYQTEHEEEHTTPYSWYKDAIDDNRIKHQIKWHDGAIDFYTLVTSGEISGDKYSYAGHNYTNGSSGDRSWLRSPYKQSGHSAWYIEHDGSHNEDTVFDVAYAVAPAFCI